MSHDNSMFDRHAAGTKFLSKLQPKKKLVTLSHVIKKYNPMLQSVLILLQNLQQSISEPLTEFHAMWAALQAIQTASGLDEELFLMKLKTLRNFGFTLINLRLFKNNAHYAFELLERFVSEIQQNVFKTKESSTYLLTLNTQISSLHQQVDHIELQTPDAESYMETLACDYHDSSAEFKEAIDEALSQQPYLANFFTPFQKPLEPRQDDEASPETEEESDSLMRALKRLPRRVPDARELPPNAPGEAKRQKLSF